jgi:hypothetical protein
MTENKNAKTPADDGKPVAWQLLGLAHFRRKIPSGSPARYWDPLYAAPPKKQWVGLTDDEIQDLSYLSQKIDEGNSPWFDRWGFARAIEQALKEKNHG